MTDDRAFMERAVANAARIRHSTSPNPWVGAVVVTADGSVFDGATEPPGGRHAERVALDAAGAEAAQGATVYTTLEPCDHTGRTGPCSQALVEAGVARVVIGVGDPDPNVAGNGIGRLEAAGIEVTVGVGADPTVAQLRDDFYAMLGSRAEETAVRARDIDVLLEAVGLAKVADALVGGGLTVRGISGGQRRRLTLCKGACR